MNKANSDENSNTSERNETARHDCVSLKNSPILSSKNGNKGAIFTSPATGSSQVPKLPRTRRIGRYIFSRSASSPAMVVQTRRKDGVGTDDRNENQIKGERDKTRREWDAHQRHVSFDECVHVLTKCSVIEMPLKNSTRFPSNAHVNANACCKCRKSSLMKRGKVTQTKEVTFSWEETTRTAILDNDLCEVQRLCQQCDANFNKKLSNGLTLLHIASIQGCFRIVQYILKQGGRVDETDDLGWTPLHYAALHGNVPCALALLRGGADINAKTDDYRTVIELAIEDEMILLLGRILNGTTMKQNQNKETYV